MAKLGDFTTIIKTLIDDTTATVDQQVIDTVNHLNCIFSIPSTDTSQSTVIGANTLNIPTGGNKIKSVFIDDVEVKEMKEDDDYQDIIEMDEQRWYIANGKITFTKNFDAVGSVIIFYNKIFTVPAAGTDTDMPDKYFELVYIGAVARYFDRLTLMVATNRQKYPDVKPDEIGKMAKDKWTQYENLIKSINLYDSNSI